MLIQCADWVLIWFCLMGFGSGSRLGLLSDIKGIINDQQTPLSYPSLPLSIACREKQDNKIPFLKLYPYLAPIDGFHHALTRRLNFIQVSDYLILRSTGAAL